MPVTRDIVATYRGPGRVMKRLLSMGQREDRALAILMAACFVVFIAQWPRLAREAHLAGEELNPMLGGALMAWLFVAPLLFYALGFLAHLILRVLGGQQSSFDARLALFWAFLAATPVLLLHGLVAGFVGPGLQLNIIGALWIALFGWFLIANMRSVGWGRT